jgi:NAD-dependent deacetylase sirtuin 5
VPNCGHAALAKLAREKEGFVAVNQNIDGQSSVDGDIDHLELTLNRPVSACRLPRRPDRPNSWQHVRDAVQPQCTRPPGPMQYSAPVSCPVNEALKIPADTNISDGNLPLPVLTREQLPHCSDCNSLMRPSVVLFGEAPPATVTDRIYEFTSAGPIDLMLVIGTSAVVFPAAGNIITARNAGARVAFFNIGEYDDDGPGRVFAGDWMFKGDAAATLPECLKGVIGAVGSG